jgi:hypothetical protein
MVDPDATEAWIQIQPHKSETFAQPTDEAVGNTMKLLTVSPKFPLSSHLSAQNLLKSYYFPASLLSNQRHLYKRSRAWGSNQ